MLTARTVSDLSAYGLQRVAIACGIFDGLHVGHQRLLATLRAEAARTGATPVVLTFEPHPQQVLNPRHAPKLLFAPLHRLRLLARLGIEATVVVQFTPEFAQQRPEAFVEREFVHSGVQVTSVIIGDNWRFGHRAQGDLALLRQLGQTHGFAVVGVPVEQVAGAPVSSSRVRERLVAGDLPAVRALLGREFSICGPVKFGKGIATSELHYPTANVEAGNELFPPCGIYASTAWLDAGTARRRLPGVLYLGNAPTYIAHAPKKPFVEMHIFDFHEDLYGRELEVDFVTFIRPDEKFATPAALREQITRDVAAARAVHAAG